MWFAVKNDGKLSRRIDSEQQKDERVRHCPVTFFELIHDLQCCSCTCASAFCRGTVGIFEHLRRSTEILPQREGRMYHLLRPAYQLVFTLSFVGCTSHRKVTEIKNLRIRLSTKDMKFGGPLESAENVRRRIKGTARAVSGYPGIPHIPIRIHTHFVTHACLRGCARGCAYAWLGGREGNNVECKMRRAGGSVLHQLLLNRKREKGEL